MPPKPLADLLAELEAIRARQALKGQLIRGSEWVTRDGKLERVETRHLLVAGRLVELTPEQLKALEDTP